MNIKHLQRTEIDEKKWNGCVHYASNGNPYGYTWHLDSIAEEWEGLVEGDYESVFPLVWNDKLLGYKQLYQPFFAQQLGLFSINMLSEKRVQTFLEAIPKHYVYVQINMNERLKIQPDWGFDVSEQPNYVLYLGTDYDEIYKNYSDNLKRNLKKASKYALTLTSNIKPEQLVEMYQKYQGDKFPELKAAAYHSAHRLIYNALHRGMGFLSAVTNEKNEVIAANFFLVSKNRIVNLMPSTTPEGKEKNAMHFLMNAVILQNTSKPMILDFEGSAVEGVAQFYKSFGATAAPYNVIRRNNLPFWFKWFKS